ncbi:hypothetical protein Moror_15707 [Moniliophthora roreri MCA 2997]|uniref:Uncharacterized protein n=2 Tax=Moniliophthora roreri TaxID=221103 RepID=V2WTX9_MONRO|nr:hypothetical protein Moror_15707 [Moniliophthora roreri MCA 2997]KAI3597454.1 hypothetical protein WG66_013186 [Moniliophthora roreri]
MLFCLRSWHPLFLTLLLVLFYLISVVSGAPRIFFIDDEHGDSLTGNKPTYSPPNGWAQGATCRGCGSRVDASLAFRNTWHESTRYKLDLPRRVEFSFTGTTISVYCIISIPNIPSQHFSGLTLDGQIMDFTYDHRSNPTDAFQYNVSVFSVEGLANTTHSLTLWTPAEESEPVFLFDYATYGFDDTTFDLTRRSITPRSPSGEKPDLAIILGGVFGGLFFLVLILFAILYHLRWRRQQRLLRTNLNNRPGAHHIDPFYIGPDRPYMAPYGAYTETDGVPLHTITPRGSSSQLNSSRTGSSQHQSQRPSSRPTRSAAVMSNTDSSSSRPSAVRSQASSSQLNSSRTDLTVPLESLELPNVPEPIRQSERRHRDHRRKRRHRGEREELRELRRQVQALRAQQDQFVQEMRPPPEYDPPPPAVTAKT